MFPCFSFVFLCLFFECSSFSLFFFVFSLFFVLFFFMYHCFSCVFILFPGDPLEKVKVKGFQGEGF